MSAAPNSTLPADRVIIKKNARQDLIMGLFIGAAVLGFVLFAVFSFNREVGGLGRPGVIIEKLFLPAPETQISIGSEGLKKEEIEGRYILRVKLDVGGEIYNVYVDPSTYARYQEGQKYLVLKPEGGGKDVFEEAAKELREQNR